MSKITKQELFNMVRQNQETLLDIDLWRARISDDVSELMFNLKPKRTQKGIPMGKKIKHDLQLQIETLQDSILNLDSEMRGIKEWVSRLSKYTLQPCVNTEVEKSEPEPEPEQTIVFDWYIHPNGVLKEPIKIPFDFEIVTQIAEIAPNVFLFLAKFGFTNFPNVYIGHYKT